MYKKKDMNIESYDGSDAFYTGSDEEYEEFLKNADVKIDAGAEAEPVENTQRVNLNETINLQNVIDKFKKTAGEIGSGAKSFKDTVVSKMDMLKQKKEANGEDDNGEHDVEAVTEKVKSAIENISNNIHSGAGKSAELTEKLDGAKEEFSDKINGLYKEIEAVSAQLDELSKKLDASETRLNDKISNNENGYSEIHDSITSAAENLFEVKQAVGSVSKLNDNIFDLKNTQFNTKNAILDLETSFGRLKRKCVLGITVLSILSAIVIVLEVLLMLS